MKKLIIFVSAVLVLLSLGGAAAQTRSNKTAIARNMTIFNSVYKELQSNYVDTIDEDKLTRYAIDAMLSQIDPYTEYYPADDQDQILSLSTGEYGGIGSVISKRGDSIYIWQPSWNSPARNAGLRHGDALLEIDGTPITAKSDVSEVSKMLRGQPGTKLHVKVRRPWVADSIVEFDLTRQSIKVDPLPYYGVDADGIGYLRLTTFNEKSAGEVKDAIADMKNSATPLNGLIIDLRGNGGGLLESAVQIVGLFTPKGTEVVRTRGFDASKERIYKTTQNPLAPDIPLVVLTDDGTASASEIVSGALQDLDRAVILGERSFGKGLVQTTRPIPYDGLLKVTTGRYYIPSGRLIQAIDYSHRNPDGSVARIPDSLTNVWHTRAGREVRDGGGITPDVAVPDSDINRLIYTVLSDNWAYNFANLYQALHPVAPDVDSLVVGDEIFAQFKNFIDPDKFKYDRFCETALTYLRDAAKAEGYMTDSVEAQFDILAEMLHSDLNRDLNYNRNEIIKILDGEISERYYSDGGQVKRALRYDKQVDSARAVLRDGDRYRSLLLPAKTTK